MKPEAPLARRLGVWAFGLVLAFAPCPTIAASTANHRGAQVASTAMRTLPGGARERVELPDWFPASMEPSASDAVREASYSIDVDLGSAPTQVAVYLPGVIGHLRVAVNGRVILDALPDPVGPSPRGMGRIQLVEIPEPQLRPGINQIELTLRGRSWISLSKIIVGPTSALNQLRDAKAFGLVYGPALVAAIISCLGLSVLLLYLRRPKETLYGYFGAAALAWGLHTLASVVPMPWLSGPHYRVWWTVLYTVVVAALASFALRFAGYRWWRLERGLWIATGLSPLVLYAAHAAGVYGVVQEIWRLGLVAVGFLGLGAVAVRAWRERSVDSALLVLAGAAAASLGAADWVRARYDSDNMPIFLAPFAGLPFVVLVTWFLIDRFVRATESLEALNSELEMRVERKSAELVSAMQSMRAARDAAEAANRAKTSFLAAASHDLRQPMHALGLYMAALRNQPMSEIQHELAERMAGSVAALESMFDSLLDLSRMDAGVLVPEQRVCELDHLLRRVVAEFAAEADQAGLRLAIRIVAGGRPLRAFTDPVLLERIVRNLIANAVKYTLHGGVLVSCRLRRCEGAAIWRIEVWDSGPGIPDAEQARVFDEFYQVGNPERDRRAGLGLGLSVVRRLTMLLGLPLQLRSTPGRGSRFRVDVTATAMSAPAVAPLITADSVAGLGVAVIEDDPEVRDGMQRLLGGWGCRVAAGADAAEVARHADEHRMHLHVVVADLRLRDGSDGLAEIAALRRHCGRDLPALVVSGDSAPERVALMQRSGLPWLSKPVPAPRLHSWLIAAMVQPAEDVA